MAVETLRAMALGGMRDHLGGGFHRYSVDARWRVPHFEKMLYDQAQLVLAFLEAAQAAGDGFYASVAEDTLDYVRRELTHAPAASTRPRTPTACRTSPSPILARTPPKALSTSGRRTRSTRSSPRRMRGSCACATASSRMATRRSDPQGEFGARTCSIPRPRSRRSARAPTGRPIRSWTSLGRARQTLFRVRASRPRPHLDDKMLTSWNGLMIAACARAGRIVSGLAPEDGAEYVACRGPGGALRSRRALDRNARRCCAGGAAGQAGIDGYCEDYACLIWGALELFQATGDAAWLSWALELQARQDALFWDEVDGGWFSTTGHDASVLLRLKEDYDGAEPAASSIGVRNLLELSHLVARRRLRRAGRAHAGAFRPAASVRSPVPFRACCRTWSHGTAA